MTSGAEPEGDETTGRGRGRNRNRGGRAEQGGTGRQGGTTQNGNATMLLGGLWHGASWTFVFWGFLHSIYLITGIISKTAQEKIAHTIGLSKFPFLLKMIHTSTKSTARFSVT